MRIFLFTYLIFVLAGLHKPLLSICDSDSSALMLEIEEEDLDEWTLSPLSFAFETPNADWFSASPFAYVALIYSCNFYQPISKPPMC
ncbi:hypothetical protein LAG90_04210 [Marinilongibacter aquaticus]|uniref:hypothetical protein n=1 Tax=Marinilongibacter aquaticus TaxID=2975157 RepID=UPI0021BD8D55|nr:hypothetical protein [Marinilongibacter aquaticus]UBM59851.1 hypothetical protein LAG90_04210 [Marinilongibacter aquaticus]